MPQLKYWNGSAWVTPKAIRVWDGSAWTQRIGKYWNGSAWVAFMNYFSNAWDVISTSGNSATYGGAGAWTNMYMHFIGGTNNSGNATAVHRRYNLSTLTYDTGAAFPQNHFDSKAVVIENDVYCNAGPNGGFRRWNYVDNTWTALAFTTGNQLNCLVKISDAKFFHHGTSNTSVQIYDVVTNVWTTVAPNSVYRSGAYGDYINGKVYMTAGNTTTFIYDVVSNTWSTGLALPTSKFQGASGVINGMFIATTGTTGVDNTAGATLNNVGYTPTTNSWTTLTIAVVAVWKPSFAMSPDGSKMFVAQGRSSAAVAQNGVYVFK
ncbi:hypothetical protein AB4Z21_19350 [Paenibacillus sp. MCAF20]